MRFTVDHSQAVRSICKYPTDSVVERYTLSYRERTKETIDMLFIRENSDGEYSGAGDWLFTGKPEEVVLQTGVFSRKGTERIIRYAFETASDLGKTLTSISKANALNYSMVFWDQVFEEVSQEYPHVETASYLVDAAALTPDVGGTFSTIEVGDAVVELIESKYVSRRISF